MDVARIIERIDPVGEIALRTYPMRPEYNNMSAQEMLRHLRAPIEERVNKNVICAAGLTVVLNGMLWSSIEDQNANMGAPYAPSYIAPIYGAIGNGYGISSTGGASVTYGTTTLIDTSQAWTVNQWAGGNVTSGASTGTILSNTSQQITLTAAWSPTPTVPSSGSPYFISQPTTGSAVVTTNVSDANLVSEVNRAVVTQAGYTAADQSGNGALQWLFLFPAPATTTTITEAGVFVNVSTLVIPPPVNTGSLLDHAAINPALTQSSTQLLTLSVTLAVG